MDRFQSFQLFVRVVESGSFSLTAKESSVSQATVSKQVSELEQFLGVKLISRTTRRLHMTEAGRSFYSDAKKVIEQFDHMVGEARHLKDKPSGTLRLATPVMFGRRQITPLLLQFQETFPGIVIEHYLSDAATDLVRDGIDLSLKVGIMKDSGYEAQLLGLTNRVSVASPEFLQRHGAPAHPTDLVDFPCLIFLGQPAPFDWNFKEKDGRDITVSVSGRYRADTSEALREAALAGLGVYHAPLSTCGEEIQSGKLVRLLSDYEPEPIPFYAVMPNSSFVPQKTRVFIDFLRSNFRKSQWNTLNVFPALKDEASLAQYG